MKYIMIHAWNIDLQIPFKFKGKIQSKIEPQFAAQNGNDKMRVNQGVNAESPFLLWTANGVPFLDTSTKRQHKNEISYYWCHYSSKMVQ